MQKQRVFVHASQTCAECHWPCKSPRNPKIVGIAHENSHKRKNGEFLVMPLKHVLSVIGLVNHPGTPKLWAIAHENDHNHKNDEFWDMSLKHAVCHGSCKSPRKPKIVGNSS
jgi:hypothetical protein